MKKLTQKEFLKHLVTLFSHTIFEVAGETWSRDPQTHQWIQHEPVMLFCPVCKCDTRVSILDNSAKLDGILIHHPESLNVQICYADAEIEPHEPTYRCAQCETPLSCQGIIEIENKFRKYKKQ